MIFARSQVWGTLKRYLMYTTAGFVVLGGMGAAWSHRPAAVDSAAADPFDGTRLAEQFVQIAALDAPIWTQRVVSDLRPSDSSVTVLAADQPPAAATSIGDAGGSSSSFRTSRSSDPSTRPRPYFPMQNIKNRLPAA